MRPEGTASGAPCPSTAAACSRTSSSTIRPHSSAGAPARRAASSPSVTAAPPPAPAARMRATSGSSLSTAGSSAGLAPASSCSHSTSATTTCGSPRSSACAIASSAAGGRQLAHAAAAQPLAHRVRHPLAGPRAPTERAGDQATVTALLGERVQIGVGRRVRSLPGVAERARDRGEQHERVEVEVGGQLVQVPRGVHLRAQHALQALGAQALDQAVVEHPRHVEDAGEGVLLGHLGEQLPQLRAVGGVAGDDARLRAQLLQLLA